MGTGVVLPVVALDNPCVVSVDKVVLSDVMSTSDVMSISDVMSMSIVISSVNMGAIVVESCEKRLVASKVIVVPSEVRR